MANHIETGKKGEALAQAYLKHKHYQIVACNWRFSRAEIDIIAKQEDLLVFIEVKTRRQEGIYAAEAAVSPHQQKLIADAAMRYMEAVGHDWEVRFDIITVWLNSDFDYEIKHFEDAFFPAW